MSPRNGIQRHGGSVKSNIDYFIRRPKRLISLIAVLLALAAAIAIPTTLRSANAASDVAGAKVSLQVDGSVEPMTPFSLIITQKGGGARTTLTFDPNLMFADTLPANMTNVQYDAAAHTLSFAWAQGSPESAEIRLVTASAAAEQTVSAVSGNLSDSVMVNPIISGPDAPPQTSGAALSVEPSDPPDMMAGGQLDTRVFPLSQSADAGGGVYFVALMSTPGADSDFGGVTWNVSLNYNSAFAAFAGASGIVGLDGPAVVGQPGSEMVSYWILASEDGTYPSGMYMSVVSLTTNASTPNGTAVNVTSAASGNGESVSGGSSQTISAAPMGIMPLEGVLGGTSPDLSNFVTDVSMTDGYGNPIDLHAPAPPELTNGDSYNFAISFAQDMLQSFAYDDSGDPATDGYLYYQLPASLVVINAVNDEPILSLDGFTIGHYWATTDGLVTVLFDELQNDGTPATDDQGNPENWIDYYQGYGGFTMNITAKLNAQTGKVDIPFGGDVTVTIDVQPQGTPALAAVKHLVSYDPATGLATFTVAVTARNDAISSITLTDFINNNVSGAALNPNGLVSNVSVSGGGLSLLSPTYLTYPDGTHFMIALDGALAAGDTATVTYSIDLSSWIPGDSDQYSINYTNTVDANGKDSSDTPVAQAEAQVSYSQEPIDYNGPTITVAKNLVPNGFDPTAKTATFRISVTAVNGSVTDLALSDVLNDTSDGIALVPSGKITAVSIVSQGSGSNLSLVSATPSYPNDGSNAFTLNFNGILASGDTVVIQYTADVSQFVDAQASQSDYSINFNNHVDVTSVDTVSGLPADGGADAKGMFTITPTELIVSKATGALDSSDFYNTAAKTASFLVTLVADGDVYDPYFDDNMTYQYDNGNGYTTKNFTFTDDPAANVTVTSVSPAAAMQYLEVSYDKGHVVFSFPGYMLPAGITMVVYYSVDISTVVDTPEGLNNNYNNLSINNDEANYSYVFTNNVEGSGSDKDGNPLNPGDASVNAWCHSTFLYKYPGIYDSNNGVYYWRGWTVGNGAVSLNGATITDSLPDGLEFWYPDDTQFNIIFYYTNTDGYTGQLFIQKVLVGDTVVTLPVIPDAAALDPNNNNQPYGDIVYVFTSADGNTISDYQYLTKIIDPTAFYNDRKYTNRIDVEFGDGTGTGNGFTVVPYQPNISGLNLTKTGVIMKVADQAQADEINASIDAEIAKANALTQAQIDADKPHNDLIDAAQAAALYVSPGDEYIEWTLNWDIPASLYQKPLYLRDIMTVDTTIDGTNWGTWSLATGMSAWGSTYSPTDLQIFVNGSTTPWNPSNYWYTPPYASAGAMGVWGIVFAPASGIGVWAQEGSTVIDYTQDLIDAYGPRTSPVSVSPFDTDTTLKITYITPLDTTYLVGGYAPQDASDKDITLGTAIKRVQYGAGGGADWRPDWSLFGTATNQANAMYSYDNTNWQGVGQDADVNYPLYKTVESVDGSTVNYVVYLFPGYWNSELPSSPDYFTNMYTSDFTDTYDSDVMEYVPYTFRLDNAWGEFGPYDSTAPYAETTQFTDNNNGTSTMTVPLGQMLMLRNYTPGGPGDGFSADGFYPITRYSSQGSIIRYSMKLKDNLAPGDYNDILNEASYNGYTSDETVDLKQPVSSFINIQKNDFGHFLLDTDPNSPTYGKHVVQFTIDFSIPGQLYGLPVTLYDLANNFYYYDPVRGGYTYGTLDNPANIVSIKAKDEKTGVTTDFTDYAISQLPPESGGWNLFLNKDSTQIDYHTTSLSPFKDDTTLTVTYNMPLDGMVYDSTGKPSGLTIEQALTGGPTDAGHFTNAACGYYTIDGNGYNVSDLVNVYSPITKKASVESDGVTVDYTIKMNVTQMYSFAAAGTLPGFTDTFSSGMVYVPDTFFMQSNSGGFAMYTAGADYTLKTDLLAGMPAEFFTVNDNGTTTMTIPFSKLAWLMSVTPDGTPYYGPTYATGATDFDPSDKYFTIHYKLRYAGGSSDPLTVSNSATAYNVTATADADITPPREVTKEMDRNSGNSVAVTVDINPTARLYDGTPNGPITVTDTMSGTLSAYLSTIKIYTEEPVGSGNWVQQPVNTTPNALWSYTPVGENEIDFIIQDSTHTRITYNCLVVGDQGTAQSISNTVEVAGYYSTASQNSFEIQSTSATGNGNRQVLTVHKYDAADDKNSLQGAQFALYAAAMNNDGTAMTGWTLPKYSASAVPAGVPGTEAINGVTFYYVGSGGAGVTDANGNFTFNNTWLTPLNFMTYLLVELQAPTNYSLPADPYTLVAYRPVAADIFGYPVNQIGDNIAVANDLIPHAQATINGIKTVLGTNNPNKVFTFALTQVDSGEIPIPGGHTDVSTTFGAGTFGFTLTDLDANSVYYYQIAETNADGSLVADDTTWTYDHDALTVKVTTDGDGSATVTYPAGSTYTDKNGVQYASFTNTYKLADAKIPVNKTAATSENVTVPVDMPTATFDLTQINKPANPAAGPNGQTAAAPGYSDSLILTGLQIPGNTTGSVAFAINGLAAGAYYYLVTEEPNGGGYWTFDQGYCIVTVTVGDESSPSVSYDYQAYVPNGSGGYAPVDAGGPDYSERAVAFTNTYSTECKVPITINKTLTGAATVDDTFIFNAYEADSAWNIASGTDPVSVSLDGTTLANDAGNGVGSVIMQLPATVGSTTYYVINEAQGGNGSVTYDGTVYYVAVTATVGQDGDIVSSTVISVSKDGSDPLPEVSFTNAFTGGPRLPETGGAGTRAYTVIGTGILLAAGMSLLFYRKRKTSRR